MRLRLVFSFVLIVLVAVVSMVLIARQTTADQVRNFMFRGGMSGNEGLVGQLEDYYAETGSWQGAQSLLNNAMHGQGRMRGGQGMGAAGMPMSQRLILADAQGVIQADSAVDGGTAAPSGALTADQLGVAIPLSRSGEVVGYLLPENSAAFSQADETRLVSALNQAALSAGLIAGGVSLLLALLLIYQFMRPVRALTHAAGQVATGDLTQRVPVSSSDELGVLGSTFNHMADSLQQAENARRAMTADIAHELRTPLAVQRAHLEALQDGIYPLNAENLTPVLEQNHLLTRLVEDLRTLALADAGKLELVRYPCDLPALAARQVERFSPQANAHQVQLILEQTSPDARLSAVPLDSGRVEQILGNLLTNALRYTLPGGKIQVQVDAWDGDAVVRVHDSGPGIPGEALPHVFERFYRADKGRSRNEGGTGIGLPIARQLARAHGGDLTGRNHPAGGAEFTLLLPFVTPTQPTAYESQQRHPPA